MIDRYGSSENIIGELIRGQFVSQVFIAKDNFLRAISFDFGTYLRKNTCHVFFEIIKNSKVIFNSNIQASQIPNNQFFELPINIKLNIGEFYELKLYSDGLIGNAITPKFGRSTLSTCIFQTVTDKIINIPEYDCRANIINCNNLKKIKNSILTTIDCKKEKCRHFTNYDEANVNGVFLKVNEKRKKGQLCCIFHYGLGDSEDINEENISSYKIAENNNQDFELSIIIPTAIRIDCLKKCLDSIRSNTPCSYEVIVIINSNSKSFIDSATKLINTYKNHSFYILEGMSGYVKTCNLGAEKSKGKFLCVMNDDVLVGHQWFEHLKDVFENDSDIAQVGPDKLSYFDNDFNWTLAKTKNVYIEGWCFVIPRWVYNKFGLFDPKIEFAYCEDSDFSTCLIRNGYKVVAAKSNVKHLQTKTSHSSKAIQRFACRCETKNKLYLKRKWFDE